MSTTTVLLSCEGRRGRRNAQSQPMSLENFLPIGGLTRPWQAGDEDVSVQKPRLIEYPRTHVTFGEVAADHVRRRVEIGRDKHVQDGASAGIQPCRYRMTGCRIELFFIAKPGSADVDRYGVEAARLGREIFLEIFDYAEDFLRHSEESLGEVEANRVVVDDGHALVRARQHRRKVSSATAKKEDILRVAQKGLHHLHIWKATLPGRRALALENLAFAIEAVARSFAFPDRDLAQLALVFAEDLQNHSR